MNRRNLIRLQLDWLATTQPKLPPFQVTEHGDLIINGSITGKTIDARGYAILTEPDGTEWDVTTLPLNKMDWNA